MEWTVSTGAPKGCLFSDTTLNISKNTTNLLAAFFQRSMAMLLVVQHFLNESISMQLSCDWFHFNRSTKNEHFIETNFSLFGHSKQHYWVSNPKGNKQFLVVFEDKNPFWWVLLVVMIFLYGGPPVSLSNPERVKYMWDFTHILRELDISFEKPKGFNCILWFHSFWIWK